MRTVISAVWQPATLLLPSVSAAVVLALGAAVIAAERGSSGVSLRSRLGGGSDLGAPRWFGAAVVALELPVTAEVAWPWAVRALGGASVVLAVWAPAVLVVIGALTCAAGPARRARARRASDRDLDRALPVLIDDVVAAMASGSSLSQGLAAASGRGGVLGEELDHALHRSSQGLELQVVLDGWAERRPASGIRLLADSLALAGATGGSQVAALRSVGDTLREREAQQREVGAMAAQAQLSATVLVITPAAFAVLVALLDHRIAAFLLTSPLGWACLAGGAALDGAGAWWMRRLVGAVS